MNVSIKRSSPLLLIVCVGGGEEVTQPVARQPQWDKYFFSKNLKLGF